ncbi:hypothetical protein TNCV_1551101 [Trichonephila clavipes]|nr:hypothetical protein TNCV_1551101 [Trichonephila clavipes]
MKEDINLYDTSGYDENNIYNLPLVNKKVIGKMKDENKGNIMTEYVGLKSKMRKTTQQDRTTQLGRIKQLNSTAGMKQLDSVPPATACIAFTAESAFLIYLPLKTHRVGEMQVKSDESSNVLPLVWCGS